MADFFTKLWESVFISGTTPTLLVATNVTFAALQALLAALFCLTYSIHFVILSVLCGALWAAINWFANELAQAKAKEEEAERLRQRSKAEPGWRRTGIVEDSADDEGEDTEVEDAMLKESRESLAPTTRDPPNDSSQERADTSEPIKATSSAIQSSNHSVQSRQRKPGDNDRSGEISTDSEWEKVDG